MSVAACRQVRAVASLDYALLRSPSAGQPGKGHADLQGIWQPFLSDVRV